MLAHQVQLEEIRNGFHGRAPDLERTVELAMELQREAHPRAEQSLKEMIRGTNTRWELLDQLITEMGQRLRNVPLLRRERV